MGKVFLRTLRYFVKYGIIRMIETKDFCIKDSWVVAKLMAKKDLKQKLNGFEKFIEYIAKENNGNIITEPSKRQAGNIMPGRMPGNAD